MGLIVVVLNREPGVSVSFLADAPGPRPSDSECLLNVDYSHSEFPDILHTLDFCRGNWDCAQECSVGAQRRIRCAPSLGGMTPAGAVKPRSAVCCKSETTDDDGVNFSRELVTPSLCFAHSL
jgi:hypothetical protein